MKKETETQDLNFEEYKLGKVGKVQVYARNDEHGRPFIVDAMDEDAGAIRALADRLQRCGYGVMHSRKPRAGRTYQILKATWAGQGEPPEDPLAGWNPPPATREPNGRAAT